MACPCETRTSTWRSFATISSGLYRFLAIAVLLDVKDIPQVGPLQWGWITGYQKIYIERYLLIGLPFFAIVLARGVTAFAHRYVTGIAIAAVVMLGVTSYAMFLSKSDEWTVYK